MNARILRLVSSVLVMLWTANVGARFNSRPWGIWRGASSSAGPRPSPATEKSSWATASLRREAAKPFWRGGVMIGLGDLPGGEFASEAYAASFAAGAAVVVGRGKGPGNEAFRWRETAADGSGTIEGLGFFPGGSNSIANGSRPTGRVVVGQCAAVTGYAAFRWTRDDGMNPLPGLLATSGASSEARDVSADGGVIVGRGMTVPDAPGNGFRWTAEAVATIPSLPGGDINSEARGIGRWCSGRGRVVRRRGC